jgi:tetratricopeptide (TPR) repeat protein
MKARLCIILFACISLVSPSQCGGTQTDGLTATAQQAIEYVTQGDLFFNQGLYDEALAEYTAAIELDPGLASAYFGRAKIYHFDQGLFSKASDEYSEAIALNPEYTDAYYYRGLAYIDNGVYERAISDLSAAIELDPGLIMAYNLRAWCYAQLAQWEQVSQNNLYHFYKIDSLLAEAYTGRSWSYVKQMQWDLFTVPSLLKETATVINQYAQYDRIETTLPEKPDPDGDKFPDVPYVKVMPVSGPVGTQLFIYGWGFRSGEDGVTVTWDNEIIICNISAEPDGSIQIDGSIQPDYTPRATIYVPESVQGDHLVGVYGSSFTPRGIIDDTAFEVSPQIKLSHEPHVEGVQISIIGTGFAGNEAITINLDGTVADASTTTSSNGSFNASVIVTSAKGKEYTVTANDAGGNAAQANLVLTTTRPLPTGQEPDLAEIYGNRGFAHFKRAQWAFAIADLERAYAIDPTLDRGQWNKDWAVGKQKQWDPVIADYDKVIALSTGSPVPSDTSSAGTLQEEYKLALDDYHKAIALSNSPDFTKKMERAIQFIDRWHAETGQ